MEYNSKQHCIIAEFAGWKVCNHAHRYFPLDTCPDDKPPPPPLDDALAMACQWVFISKGLFTELRGCPPPAKPIYGFFVFDGLESLVTSGRADIPRDAIFAAILALEDQK